MRLRTSLKAETVRKALQYVKEHGQAGHDLAFAVFEKQATRDGRQGYEIQLGSPSAALSGGRRRHLRRNGGSSEYPFAATWHEWGWFISRIMEYDMNATAGRYHDMDAFDEATGYLFATDTPRDCPSRHGQDRQRPILPAGEGRATARCDVCHAEHSYYY